MASKHLSPLRPLLNRDLEVVVPTSDLRVLARRKLQSRLGGQAQGVAGGGAARGEGAGGVPRDQALYPSGEREVHAGVDRTAGGDPTR